MAVLCYCQRFNFCLQHTDGIILDCCTVWMRMELVGGVQPVLGIVWFIETRGFGPIARKLTRNYVKTDFISFQSKSFFFSFRLFQLQMGTMASVHASTNPSLAGSRPTTPYTTSTIH